ncbi:GntR family transcriptional regulator [Williamsia sp.]|uniref:GntR family transcriptional regulator n=1 Tax=Williamsia sp. TaxID=1872085 RepID=UPI002F93F0DE
MAVPSRSIDEHGLPISLVDVAGRRIRESILSGALKPGDKIVEEQLCASLGISRAPLREALRLLGQQGLVEHLPRRGSRVAEWSPQDILQLFELRHVLERHAIESALPLADLTTDLDPVRDALDDMRVAADRDDDLEKDDAHRRFHASVVGLAGNRQLDIAMEPILLKLQLPMAINLRNEARVLDAADGIRRHQLVLDALETNDPRIAVAAARNHGQLDFLDLERNS